MLRLCVIVMMCCALASHCWDAEQVCLPEDGSCSSAQMSLLQIHREIDGESSGMSPHTELQTRARHMANLKESWLAELQKRGRRMLHLNNKSRLLAFQAPLGLTVHTKESLAFMQALAVRSTPPANLTLEALQEMIEEIQAQYDGWLGSCQARVAEAFQAFDQCQDDVDFGISMEDIKLWARESGQRHLACRTPTLEGIPDNIKQGHTESIKTGYGADIKTYCDDLQYEFENYVCFQSYMSSSYCETSDLCMQHASEALAETQEYLGSELQRIRAYLQSWLADSKNHVCPHVDDKQQCQSITLELASLDIKQPPPSIPCVRENADPCDEDWRIAEYSTDAGLIPNLLPCLDCNLIY
jgi:hypothetical protein